MPTPSLTHTPWPHWLAGWLIVGRLPACLTVSLTALLPSYRPQDFGCGDPKLDTNTSSSCYQCLVQRQGLFHNCHPCTGVSAPYQHACWACVGRGNDGYACR